MPKGNGMMYNDKYNAPDNYTDMDGMTKTFTHINYAKKTKISMNTDIEDPTESLKEYKKDLQEEILSLPASLVPKEFTDFIVRGADYDIISWNESMIKDEGVPITKLQTLKTLTQNRIEHYSQGIL